MEQQGMTLKACMENYDVLIKLLSRVQDENEHILRALSLLEQMPTGRVPGDIAGQARAHAIAEIVKKRETTNQELLRIYSRMYCDLREILFPKPDAERS